MSWYSTGTVQVTNGSTAVVGTGTGWFGALQFGWGFVGPDGRLYEITTVASDTALTLATPYQGSTAGAQVYAAVPTAGTDVGLVQSIQALIAGFQAVKDGPGQGKFTGNVVLASDPDTGLSWPSSNEVALLAGGAIQLALIAGQATGAAVQADPADTTTGKLVTTDGARAAASSRYGGYYPGGSGINIDTVVAGFVGLVADTNAGTWPGASTGGFAWIDTQAIYAGEAVLQTATFGYGSTSPGQTKTYRRIRANSGGAWSAWVKVMTDADQVMTVGDGGLLAQGAVINDFSTIPAASQFIAGGGAGITADAPPQGGGYKPGLISYRSSSSRASVLMFTNNGIAIRNYTSGVPDGDWVELSAPERGSNSNGEYVRLSNGLQICTHAVNLTGGGAVTITGGWTFPAAFVATPAIALVSRVAPPAATRERSLWVSSSGTTSSNLNASMNVNWPANTSEQYAVTATGYWK